MNRSAWVHTLGVGVAKAMSGVIAQLRGQGEHHLATALTVVKLDWERAIRRRCDELDGQLPLQRPRVSKPVRTDYHAHVEALRAAYGARKPPLRVVLAKDSVQRMRQEAVNA